MQNISTTFTGMRYCAHERKHVATLYTVSIGVANKRQRSSLINLFAV